MTAWTKDQADHRIELPLTGVDCMRTLHRWMSEWEDDDRWQLLRLSLHEWVANMLQHATFGPQHPRLSVFIKRVGHRIEALIEDNSEGFDLYAVPQARFHQFPDRGMGITLMQMCSDQLEYRLSPAQNKLFFSIPLRAEQLSLVPYRAPGVVASGLPTAA